MTEILFPVERLDQAIRNVLGSEIALAMKSGGAGRVRMHEYAILRAFVYGCDSQDEFVLKYAKLYLDRHGEYM